MRQETEILVKPDPKTASDHPMPDYGNWVSINIVKKVGKVLILLVGLCSFSFLPLTETWPKAVAWSVRVVFLLLAAALILLEVYFLICRSMLAYEGSQKIQDKVLAYVLDHFTLSAGKIIDIGCGSGALTIKTAQKFPDAQVTGVDFWGEIWNYAKEQCEENARLENVGNVESFRKGDAAKLDFPDEYFDGAVSNFVFHEVKSQPDKRLVVKEALRVVKKGGVFAFHDIFLEKNYYGDITEFIKELESDGIDEIHFVQSKDEIPVPGLLRTGFMLGKIGLIYGRK